MTSEKRKESWARHDAKRKQTENRKTREQARSYVRFKKIPKRGVCYFDDMQPMHRGPTVLHHLLYEPVVLIEVCAKCHRRFHPRVMPSGAIK